MLPDRPCTLPTRIRVYTLLIKGNLGWLSPCTQQIITCQTPGHPPDYVPAKEWTSTVSITQNGEELKFAGKTASHTHMHTRTHVHTYTRTHAHT